MPTDYSKLTDQKLDEHCAQILEPIPHGQEKKIVPPIESRERAWTWLGAWVAKPFSSDLNAARELEDEIERRGLQIEYASKLLVLIHCVTHFDAIHAKARQRAEAFAATMEQINA